MDTSQKISHIKTVGELPKYDCCGCRSCEKICPVNCITMAIDAEGFQYPQVDDSKCIECGLCLKTCPFQVQTKREPIQIYAAKSLDTELKQKSASGGIFATIAKWGIENDYFIFGCSYIEGFVGVSHVCVDNVYDLASIQGSKYVQSDTNDTFNQVKKLLSDGHKVIYSGTGCQIQGLKNFLRKDFQNLITIDILCFGVPSPMMFRDYVNCMENKFGRISDFIMRDKSDGWGYGKIPKIKFDNKDINLPTQYRKGWFDIYFSNYINRPSCYNCKFTSYKRSGDITLGDYWGIEKYHPGFIDKGGVSLAFINTQKGLDLFNKISECIQSIVLSPDECQQPVLLGPQIAPSNRDSFWARYYKHGFKDIAYSYFGLRFKNPLLLKINRKLKKNIF